LDGSPGKEGMGARREALFCVVFLSLNERYEREE
jgi:hypothetical protein